MKYRGVAERFYNKAWRKIARDAGVAPAEIRRWRKKRLPTKQEVVEVLRNRLVRGEQVIAAVVLREDPRLHEAVVHHFGSFYACYGSIGLRQKDIPTRLKYRTKYDVVAQIRRRHRSCQRLNAAAVEHGQGRDYALVERARKLFRSWDRALKAAGLESQKIRLKRPAHRYESPTAVVGEIKRRKRQNLPLYWDGVARGTYHDRGLQRRAIRFFGSWDKALGAAGLPPERIRRRTQSKHLKHPSVLFRLVGVPCEHG